MNKLADKVVARELLMQGTSEPSAPVDHYETLPDEVFRLLKVLITLIGPVDGLTPF